MTDDDLLRIYNGVFDVMVTDPTTKAGAAHAASLRAIYEKGKEDAGGSS